MKLTLPLINCCNVDMPFLLLAVIGFGLAPLVPEVWPIYVIVSASVSVI